MTHTMSKHVGQSSIREAGTSITLKEGKILLRTFRPEDREALISFYASLSAEALRWSSPPYDRARIEKWP